VVAKPFTWPDDSEADAGVSVVSVPEMRWARRDIKSIALLPNILAKQQAREAGAFEAWFVAADGAVLEGASTNAWMIDAEGRAITHPLGPQILAGVTRASVIRFAEEAQIKVIERPFSLVEAKRARELFLTSTTSLLRAVVRLDGTMIGDGRPGPLARQLRARCLQHYRMRLAHGA
jgi:D-alanine transaminase